MFYIPSSQTVEDDSKISRAQNFCDIFRLERGFCATSLSAGFMNADRKWTSEIGKFLNRDVEEKVEKLKTIAVYYIGQSE